MIWCYDHAICDDLNCSFNTESQSVVKVVDPEGAVDIVAQIKDDNVKFPLVVLSRNNSYTIDQSRTNFTLMHKGVVAGIDPETNKMYIEKAIPISLEYKLTILTTNTADMDELMKELMFKYLQMYYLTITLPYESKRKIRFGVSLDRDSDIEQSSGSVQYLQSGSLYQSILPLKCEGCVLISYTPMQLRHEGIEVQPIDKEKLRTSNLDAIKRVKT